MPTNEERPLHRAPAREKRALHTASVQTPGAMLRFLAIGLNMTQTELAAHLGISAKHLSALINHRIAITPRMARRLAERTGVSAAHWRWLNAQRQLIEGETGEDTGSRQARG